MKRLRMAEDVFTRLLPRRAGKGSTGFERMGDVVQQPPVWACLAALLALAGGPRGQRAAVRGVRLLRRDGDRGQPPHQAPGGPEPASGFGEGTDGADHVLVALRARRHRSRLHAGRGPGDPRVVPSAGVRHLGCPLVPRRSRGHYPSDVFVGGVVGVAVALAVWKLWRPGGTRDQENRAPGGGERTQPGRLRLALPRPARRRWSRPALRRLGSDATSGPHA